jgi:AraC-like DNA-binding protein
MRYNQIQPPGYIKNYVRYFWTLESTCEGTVPKTFGPVADGCPGFIFQQAEKGSFYDEVKEDLPALFLYGQTTRPREIHTGAQFHALGASFYPNALKLIFGFNANELTDTCIDLNALSEEHGTPLSDKLLNSSSIHDQVEILSSFLFLLIQKNNVQTDKAIHFVITEIIASNGSVSLRDLQQRLQVSERSLERKFKECVGISPKLFARICRFQASLHQLRSNRYTKLSDIAFENGYADQSHYIRAFQEFAGFSPYQYQKQSLEVVANFPELIRQV